METQDLVGLLYRRGFRVSGDTGQYRLIRRIDGAMVAGGDLGSIHSVTFRDAVNHAVLLVDRILKDESERLAQGNATMGALGSSVGGDCNRRY
jgi:hypothetical protein